MKDRIKQLMESLHMNQQSFASFVGIAPATLNGIFQERTRPTLNTVEAICKKMPNVNLMWLINGTGDMYVNLDAPDTEHQEMGDAGYGNVHGLPADHGGVLDFTSGASSMSGSQQRGTSSQPIERSGRNVMQGQIVDVKNIDKQARRITEIRVFYDDQTWESFVPKK